MSAQRGLGAVRGRFSAQDVGLGARRVRFRGRLSRGGGVGLGLKQL